MEITIDTEDLMILLARLGIDVGNQEIRDIIYNEFLSQYIITKQELIDSVLKQGHFPINHEGYKRLILAIELTMENPRIKKIYGLIAQKETNKDSFTMTEYSMVERSIRNLFEKHFEEYSLDFTNYPEFVQKMYKDGYLFSNLKLINYLSSYISYLQQNKESVKQKILK